MRSEPRPAGGSRREHDALAAATAAWMRARGAEPIAMSPAPGGPLQTVGHGGTGYEGQDQAATLRRLFAVPCAQVLPVLLPDDDHAVRVPWLAKLAQGFARHGSRTLVVDAARAHLATAFGLRARYELCHALRGECSIDAALLDAGPGLALLPAARTAQHALRDGRRIEPALRACIAQRGGFDLVMLLLGSAHAALLPAGDVLVPVEPTAASVSAVLPALERAALLGQIGAFRLLFLGMEQAAAATLAQRLATRVAATARAPAPAVASAGAALVARDLAPVVLAASGWNLERVTAPDVETLA